MRAALASAVVLALARTAAAEPVTVRVVEVAGGVAYVTPGRAAGLVPGTHVRLRGRDLVVIEATEKTAAVKAEAGLAPGETGSANVDRAATEQLKMLPKPHPQQAFRGQWPDAVPPAETQRVQPVSLGAARVPGRAHVTIVGHGYGVASSSPAGEGEARVIASFELMTDRPLAADVDVAGRAFSAGYDRETHTPMFVRAAELRYGSEIDPTLALGRLRFAASSVGMLDGGRAAAHVGSLELAAFGGLVPDPVNGKPSTDASRFGAELVYDRATTAWQPRVSLTAEGSTWMGRLDERRLSLVASANHAATWLDGWAEAQQFPAGNPWNAPAIQLTGAGGTFEWRDHGAHAGVDVTFLRPERSLRLAAALPPEWLCTLVPRAGITAEPCAGSDYWASASGSAGVRTPRFAIDAVGTLGDSHGVTRGYDASGYLRSEVYVGRGRVIASASGGYASFATWYAAEAGVGAALSRRLTADVTYRPELLDYRAGTGPVTLHSLVFDGSYAVSSSFDLAASGLATTGAGRDAIALLATFVWRPLP